MDYDQTPMPAAYDAGRGYAPGVLERWLSVVSAAVAGDRVGVILDLGCGTGRYSAGLASHFGAEVVAVDPSEKMLAEAVRKFPVGVRFLRGSGESLPLDAGTVDMVFISMVFHHFVDPHKAAEECRRVLRGHGAVCVRAGCTDRIASYAYVPFFPRTPRILSKSLRSIAFLTAVFEDAGFRLDRHDVIASPAAEDWASYAERLAHRADSILIQLTDAEFEDGLAALRLHAANQAPGVPVTEPVDFLVFRPL